MTETGRTVFLSQLSFAWRLGFRRYDGCQTPVASCEDTEGEGVRWYGFGLGSVALAEDSNSALDLHFGSRPIKQLPNCRHVEGVGANYKKTKSYK